MHTTCLPRTHHVTGHVVAQMWVGGFTLKPPTRLGIPIHSQNVRQADIRKPQSPLLEALVFRLEQVLNVHCSLQLVRLRDQVDAEAVAKVPLRGNVWLNGPRRAWPLLSRCSSAWSARSCRPSGSGSVQANH
eukprot:4222827-Prymnesium_polylepis.1